MTKRKLPKAYSDRRKAFLKDTGDTVCGPEEMEAILAISDDLDVEPEDVMRAGAHRLAASCGREEIAKAFYEAIGRLVDPEDIDPGQRADYIAALRYRARVGGTLPRPLYPRDKERYAGFSVSAARGNLGIDTLGVIRSVVDARYGSLTPSYEEAISFYKNCVKQYGKKDGEALYTATVYASAYFFGNYRGAGKMMESVRDGESMVVSIDRLAREIASQSPSAAAVVAEYSANTSTGKPFDFPKASDKLITSPERMATFAILRMMAFYGSPFAWREIKEWPDSPTITAGAALRAARRIGFKFTGKITQHRLFRGMQKEAERGGARFWNHDDIARIALAHLREDPAYYEKLSRCMKKR